MKYHFFAKPEQTTYRGVPATYYWHSVGRTTFVQGVALAVVIGPITYAISDSHTLENFIFNVAMWFLAPLIVDALKPTYVLQRG